MNKTKKFLLSILLTNLLCTFVTGHGGIPLGLLEFLTLYSAITLNFVEFPLLSFWTLAAVLMIIGQVLSILAIRKDSLVETIQYGRVGTILLTLPVILIFLLLSEQLWILAVISSTPFLVLTIIFWWTTINSKGKLLINGT